MMEWLLIPCVVGFAANSICTRLFQVRFRNSAVRLPLYQSFFCIAAAVLFFAFAPAVPRVETWLFGLAFGILFFVAAYFGDKGFDIGSMALTSTIVNMGMILPVLYSAALLKEPVTVLQIVGMVLFAAVFVLSSGKDEEDRKARKSSRVVWLTAVAIAFVANGMTAVLQKYYRLNFVEGQNDVFMAVAYLTSGLLFLVCYFRKGFRVEAAERSGSFPALLGIALLSGIGSYAGNHLLSELSGKMDGAILYPCVNGGLCVLVGVLSFFVFREKVTARKLVAFSLGVLAIILLNL